MICPMVVKWVLMLNLMSECFLKDMKGMDLDERGNGQQIKIIDGRRLA